MFREVDPFEQHSPVCLNMWVPPRHFHTQLAHTITESWPSTSIFSPFFSPFAWLYDPHHSQCVSAVSVKPYSFPCFFVHRWQKCLVRVAPRQKYEYRSCIYSNIGWLTVDSNWHIITNTFCMDFMHDKTSHGWHGNCNTWHTPLNKITHIKKRGS